MGHAPEGWNRSALRPLAITVALLVLVVVASLVRYAPPAPASRDAPRDQFSAERARDVQARLVGDGATRWIGTEGNQRGREVVAAELERLGWNVETQRATSCTHHGMCGVVANVVAHLPGSHPELGAVLVSAHHDSVLVSPGASDDGVGTATVLETARALVEGPRPRRTVIALLTDGEEAGLLGADAFARSHPLASKVRTTVNVDARGSHGPSQMFETSRGNDWLVALMASRLPRPVTTSLYYEVYKRMPNDTDFTITKTIASGMNFANTFGIWDYHTPLDDLQNASLGTLQHHGDHVLAMTRALADEPAGSRSDTASRSPEAVSDDVWFDVLALGVVRWPERWSVLFALVSLSIVLGQSVRARAKDRGLFAIVAIVPGVAAAAFAGWALRTSGAIPALWVAHRYPAIIAIHALAGAGTLGVILALAAKSTPRALWAGTWVGWGALGVATASTVPGASYLFVVPTAFAAASSSLSFEVACVVPAVAAQVLVVALGTGIYEALGFAAPALLAMPTILLSTTIAPMLVGLPRALRRAPLALAALGLAAAIAAVVAPKFSAEEPQRVNVVFRQDAGAGGAGEQARIYVDNTWGPSTWGAAPPAMLAAIGEVAGREPALPWTMATPFATAAPISAPPPAFEVEVAKEVEGRRVVKGRARSPRGAPTIALFFPAGRQVEVKVAGRYAHPRVVTGGHLVGLLAVPAEGVEVEIDAPGADPIAVTMLDRTSGVPPGTKAAAAVEARPKDAAPFQDGDVTVVTAKVTL